MGKKNRKTKKNKRRNVTKKTPARTQSLQLPKALSSAFELHQKGELEKAGRLYQRILDAKPDHADALHLMGVIAFQKNEFAQSAEMIRKAIVAKPETGLYYGNLGNSLRRMGDLEGAEEAYKNAIRYKEDFAQAHYNLGLIQSLKGEIEAAAAGYRRAVELQPDYAEAHNNLGNLYKEQGKADDALNSYRKAIQNKPDYHEAYNNMGNIYKDQGRTEDAVACYRKAVEIKPDFTEAYNNMGNTLIYDRNRVDEAWESFAKALEHRPDDLWAVAGQAKIRMRNGDFDGAREHLLPYLDVKPVNVDVAVTYAQLAVRFGEYQRAIDLLESLWRQGLKNNDERRQVLYNLGDLYDKAGSYDNAFDRYRKANELRNLSFDADMLENNISRIMAAYNEGYGKRMPKAINRSQLPVFIVGMPRSGTSLVEQIIASHSRCFGAGELAYIVRMVNELGKRLNTKTPYPENLTLLNSRILDGFAQSCLRHLLKFSKTDDRITDKMPLNFLHLGFISLLFPEARVIHCVRDPRDTAVSIFFQNFSDGHPYAADLTHIGSYYRQYQRLMDHWGKVLELPILTVQYEKLVSDQEIQSRKIIEFIGMDWEESCLQFYKAKRSVSTASYQQVRQPIYNKSVERWRNYEAHLQPLMGALDISPDAQ